MMKRLLWLISFVGVGLVLIAFGLTIPAHLRALDARAVLRHSPGSPSVIDEGLSLTSRGKVGPAMLLLKAAQQQNFPEANRLASEVEKFSRSHPDDLLLGGADPYLPSLINPKIPKTVRQPIIDLLISRESREGLFQLLSASRNPNMIRLLAIRGMTNTVHFPPVNSVSGQPLDAAILLTGLLLHENQLSTPLRDRIEYLAARAKWDNNLELLELIFLDLLSAGRHLSWAELTDFAIKIQDPLTLQRLANRIAVSSEQELPTLFTVIHMAGSVAPVAGYLNRYEQTGLADLAYSLRAGRTGLRLVLDRQERIYYPSASMRRFGALNPLMTDLLDLVAGSDLVSLILKMSCLGVGALFIALAVARCIPGGGTHLFFVPEILFALGFLAIAVLVTEPFLKGQTQSTAFPLQWKFPMASGALRAAIEKKVNPKFQIDPGNPRYVLNNFGSFFNIQTGPNIAAQQTSTILSAMRHQIEAFPLRLQ